MFKIEILLLDGSSKNFLSELSEFIFCSYNDTTSLSEFICKSCMSIHNSDLFSEITI